MSTCIYIYTCICICRYVRSWRHMRAHTCIYIYTYIHTYIHTYINTCIHTYIHTHTHTQIACNQLFLPPRHETLRALSCSSNSQAAEADAAEAAKVPGSRSHHRVPEGGALFHCLAGALSSQLRDSSPIPLKEYTKNHIRDRENSDLRHFQFISLN